MIDFKSNYKVSQASNFSFGILLFLISLCFNLYYLFITKIFFIPYWIFSILLFLISFFAPNIFYWPKKIWIEIGNFIGRFVSFFVLILIFCTIFIPTGIIIKLLNIDLLNLKSKTNLNTFWIKYKNFKSNMKDQF